MDYKKILYLSALIVFAMFAVLGLLTAGMFINVNVSKVYPTSGVINVRGEGEVVIVPDMAEFTVTCPGVASTSSEARGKSASLVAAVTDILFNEFNLGTADVSTGSVHSYPEYEWNADEQRNEKIGMRVVQTLHVNVVDVEMIGPLYDRLLDLDDISLSDPVLDSSERAEAMDQARVLAFNDAYGKADTYAGESGLIIVSASDITENGSFSNAVPLMARMNDSALSGSIDYMSSDIKVRCAVDVGFETARIDSGKTLSDIRTND